MTSCCKEKLKNIADVIQGQSPESIYYSDVEGTPFLQGNRTFGNLYPYYDIYTNKITKKANKGDVLMSIRAPVGALNIAPSDLCIGRGLASIRAKNGDNRFIYYALKNSMHNLTKQGAATTFDSVNKDTINNFEIFIPSIEEDRRKVSKLLSAIDDKIELNNKISLELDTIAKELYAYRFLQFDFPENGKPYKSSGGLMTWSEELKRRVPEGWEVKKIKNVIQHINTGLNPRQNFKLNDGGNIKYITVKNLTSDGTLDFSGCDLITKESKDMINQRSQIMKGDILFASIAPLGRCYLMYETPTEWEINESVFSIRSNDFVSPEYLYMYFMSEEFVKGAEHSSTGSVFSGIRIGTLEDMKILIPDKKIVDKFSEKVQTLYSMKKNIEKQNQDLSELRDFLLPMLMNGQVTVK